MEMNFFKGFIALSLVILLVLIGTYWYQKSEASSANMLAEQEAGPAALDFEAEDSTIHQLNPSATEEAAGQDGGFNTQDSTTASGEKANTSASVTEDSSTANVEAANTAPATSVNGSGESTGDVIEATTQGITEDGNGTEDQTVSSGDTAGSPIGESFLKNYLGMSYDDLIKTAGKPDQQTEEDSVQKLNYNDVDIMGMKGRITVKLSYGEVHDASWYVNEGKASDYKSEIKKLTEYLDDQYLQSDTHQWVVASLQWVGLDGFDTNERLGIVFY